MKLFEDSYAAGLNVVSNMGGFYVCLDDDWVYPGGRFRQNKFYYITSGECVIFIEGKEFHGRAGDWFFIPANAYHSFHNIKGSGFKKFWSHFDVYPDNKIFERLSLPYCFKVSDREAVDLLFKNYARHASSKKLSDIILAKGYLTELLGEYINAAGESDVFISSKESEQFDDLLRYINENIERDFSNSQLASMLYIHPNHLIRLFKEKTGKTPSRYIAERKMERARRLIETSDKQISQISEAVGISDYAYFSRLFKSCYGMSPSYCRKYFAKSWYTDDI